jgi:hypothetical protein
VGVGVYFPPYAYLAAPHSCQNPMPQLDPLTLRIYRAPNGRWSGKLLTNDGEEVGAIAGCLSPEEVEETARGAGFAPSHVEVEAPRH